MKRTLIPVLMLLLLLAGCRQKPSLPNTTSAAWELYQHYADWTDVTVALIGDYKTEIATYNVVMMEADDSAAWEKMDREFNLNPKDAPFIRDKREKVKEQISDMSDKYFSDCEKAPQESDSVAEAAVMDEVCPADRFIRDISITHGHFGYMKLANNTDHILWIFFFNSAEEYHAILDALFAPSDSTTLKTPIL